MVNQNEATQSAPGEPELEKAASPPQPEANDRSEAVESPPDEGAADSYHQRARLAEDRLAEVLTAYRTLRTDTDAYRDRISRNIERRYEQRRQRLLLKFIDILDNLDRALTAAETTSADEALIQGLILVRTRLLQTLQEEGLERIPVLGLPYDPVVSEAVETQTVEDPDQHHVVVKEALRGYRLLGRVVRPSRVVVGEFAGAQGNGVSPASLTSGPGPAPLSEEAEGTSLEETGDRPKAQED